ncbi:MAG: redoxin domain-containing protein [Planctomycetota bacterium]
MPRLAVSIVFAVAALAAGGCASAQKAAPAQAIDGTAVDPLAGPAGSLGVVVFVSHECPIANAMAPDLTRLAQAARARGVDFYAVHPATWATTDIARRHAQEFGLAASITVLVDPSQRIARAFGATVTPEAAVYRRDGEGGFRTLYLGRVSDLYAGIGRRRAQPTTNDLADAIDLSIAGRPVPEPYPKAIGCFIELQR